MHCEDQMRALVLVPFQPEEAITLKEAAHVAGRSEATIRGYCRNHDIGRRIPTGGPWRVSRVALHMLLENDLEALDTYLAGDRQSPSVQHYFRRLGVPIPRTEDGRAGQ